MATENPPTAKGRVPRTVSFLPDEDTVVRALIARHKLVGYSDLVRFALARLATEDEIEHPFTYTVRRAA